MERGISPSIQEMIFKVSDGGALFRWGPLTSHTTVLKYRSVFNLLLSGISTLKHCHLIPVMHSFNTF